MSLLFLMKEGLMGLKRARVSALIAILTIALALSLFGGFGLIGQNVKDIFLRFYTKVELEVFLSPSISSENIRALENDIRKNPHVSKVTYVSREDALQEFQKSFGQDLSGVLDNNPLPASFRVVIKPDFSSPQIIETLSEGLKKMAGVEDVLYEKDIVRFVHKYLTVAIVLVLVVAAVLLLVITILIFNTIRLTISSRKEIIQIMRLVGATNFFIKSPFIIEGVIEGLVGSLLSAGLLLLFSEIIKDVFFSELSVPENLFLVLIVLGTLLGWLGSYLSVNKYLRS